MGSKHKNTYLYLWLLLAVALAVVCAISFFDSLKIGDWEVQKGSFADVILAEEGARGGEEYAAYADDYEEAPEEERVVVAQTDTTVKSVLIFGDSMTVLVANRLAAYGEKNGYKVTSVTWDGSNSISWSGCDTLENFIARCRPDFIMVTLGSNELFLKNFELRRPYVEKLVAKIGDIPFVWIGPPNWKEDTGFNAMMKRALPRGTYFDSNGLDLPRGKDHIHPTPSGGITWTDSIMSWMAFTPHPIPAERPDPGVRTRSHAAHYFKAGKGKAAPAAREEAADAEFTQGEATPEEPARPEQSPTSEPAAEDL